MVIFSNKSMGFDEEENYMLFMKSNMMIEQIKQVESQKIEYNHQKLYCILLLVKSGASTCLIIMKTVERLKANKKRIAD